MSEFPGDALLDKVAGFLRRFVSYPSEDALIAHVLWVAHTHGMNAWYSTPRLALLSPEPGSGKTRGLEVTELLVPRPVQAVNVSPSYLFRKVADPDGLPTILYDEIDTVFGPKARENEELRGLLNAGHRRGAIAGRVVMRAKTPELEDFPAYCAVALAGLGDLPDTILSRSIILRMKRRAPSEVIEPFRRREQEPEGNALRELMAEWMAFHATELVNARPTMPNGIADRDADVWEPLLAIADAAGGEWPERARVSAVSFVSGSKRSEGSLGVRLLSDLRDVFGERDALPTTEILEALKGIDDAPWRDLRGKPLDARGLARRLQPYGVSRVAIRLGPTTTTKGYRGEDLFDAWERYLPSPSSAHGSETSETGKPDECPPQFETFVCKGCEGRFRAPPYEDFPPAWCDDCAAARMAKAAS